MTGGAQPSFLGITCLQYNVGICKWSKLDFRAQNCKSYSCRFSPGCTLKEKKESETALLGVSVTLGIRYKDEQGFSLPSMNYRSNEGISLQNTPYWVTSIPVDAHSKLHRNKKEAPPNPSCFLQEDGAM